METKTIEFFIYPVLSDDQKRSLLNSSNPNSIYRVYVDGKLLTKKEKVERFNARVKLFLDRKGNVLDVHFNHGIQNRIKSKKELTDKSKELASKLFYEDVKKCISILKNEETMQQKEYLINTLNSIL